MRDADRPCRWPDRSLMRQKITPNRSDLLRLLARRRFCVELPGKPGPRPVYQESDSLLSSVSFEAPGSGSEGGEAASCFVRKRPDFSARAVPAEANPCLGPRLQQSESEPG